MVFFSIAEETEVIVNSMEEDVWGAEYERKGLLFNGVGSWYLLCL